MSANIVDEDKMQDIPLDVSINVTSRYLPLSTLYAIKNREVRSILLKEVTNTQRFDEALDLLADTGDTAIATLLVSQDPEAVLDVLFGNQLYSTVERLLETLPGFADLLDEYVQNRSFTHSLNEAVLQTTTLGDFLLRRRKVSLLQDLYPNVPLMLDTISRYQRLLGGVPEYEWFYLARYVDIVDSFERYLRSNPELLQAYRERLVDPTQSLMRDI